VADTVTGSVDSAELTANKYFSKVHPRFRAEVPVAAISPADSPRLSGEDPAHVARLAEVGTSLPPILVKRSSMQVIDGMHRLHAAMAKGHETIEVEFFDGSDEEAFLLAVQANIGHGLPLTMADRVAAVERIVLAQPHLSDRFVATAAGLSASTVAAIRSRATDGYEQLDRRLGRDGKLRPVDGAVGRLKAAELLKSEPGASLRDVARKAGISPSTVRDVRARLSRGEDPVLGSRKGRAERLKNGDVTPGQSLSAGCAETDTDGLLKQLARDPSLRHSEKGRLFVRTLWTLVATVGNELPGLSNTAPAHVRHTAAELLRYSASTLRAMADDFDAG
jgi:ParB-like chromosome segregation protein Spo0J